MTATSAVRARLSTDKPLSLAILAMGGQGGGVLADWIVALAEAEGWIAQSTSVPGVAQRTGATIYYIEMMPPKDGKLPVLSLMPSPGDVDIVLAAEFMEAGRSILRGLVTPDRTTLIASTHRAYAVVEKEQPGDGIGDPLAVVAAAGVSAKRNIAFDMQAIAEQNGSVISSSLFGALAGAGVLPFDKAAFESVIRAGGKGVGPSLATFAAAESHARERPREAIGHAAPKRFEPLPGPTGHAALDALVARIAKDFPQTAHTMLFAGARKVVDFQDAGYAADYLDRIAHLLARDEAHGGDGRNHAFTLAAAKYLAVAMAYDDVVRVADLKLRASRFARVRTEGGAGADQLVYTTEFMHPRMAEVVATMPERLGLWLEARPRLLARLDRIVNRGRRVRSGTIAWFVPLYLVGGLRRFRRGTLRHKRETAHIADWLGKAEALLPQNYDLAVEVLQCRRLVKGYSDTHARGAAKFDRVLAAVPALAERDDGAAWLRRLRQAALLDEDGIALDGALKTIASL